MGAGLTAAVNDYLKLALDYGLTVLTIYCSAIIVLGIGLLRLAQAVKEADDREMAGLRAINLAMLTTCIVTTVMTGPISNISLVPTIGILVLAIAAATLGAARKELNGGNVKSGNVPAIRAGELQSAAGRSTVTAARPLHGP